MSDSELILNVLRRGCRFCQVCQVSIYEQDGYVDALDGVVDFWVEGALFLGTDDVIYFLPLVAKERKITKKETTRLHQKGYSLAKKPKRDERSSLSLRLNGIPLFTDFHLLALRPSA